MALQSISTNDLSRCMEDHIFTVNEISATKAYYNSAGYLGIELSDGRTVVVNKAAIDDANNITAWDSDNPSREFSLSFYQKYIPQF